MSRKKLVLITIILGAIALLEIGGAVALLFYSGNLREREAGLNATTPTVTAMPTPTSGKVITNTPVATNTPDVTNTPASTNTPVQTGTPTPTFGTEPIITKIPGNTSAPTDPPIYTNVPTNPPDELMNEPTPTPTPAATATPKPTSEVPSEDTVVAPSTSGRLSVSGAAIVDKNGNAVQLKGISTAGLQWFPQFVDQKAFHQFRYEWGVNVMRLALYTDEGGYCSGGNKANLKALVEKGVKYATAEDMYVIIDWHILHDNDPNKYKSEALVFFDEMSAKYKDYNNVIYEICNEPNGGTNWKTIKSYALEVIKVIRKNDPNAIIIVGTPTWSQEVDKAAADPITGYDNIMYTLHFYADTHKDSLRNTMEKAIKKGLPIFVTEYGITDASGNGACNEAEANKWMALMDKYGISSCIWNLANKNESSCLLVSSCNKTNGFTLSDLSQEGKWFYNMVTSGKGGLPGDVPDYPDDGDGDGGGSGEPEDIAGTEYVITQGNLQVTFKVSGAWKVEGSCKYQYEVTVKNIGTSAIDNWSFTIPFASDISGIPNYWCCKCQASGKKLTVSNESWNGRLEPNASTGSIGIELLSDEKQKPLQ